MTLLEVIVKASNNPQTQSKYPIILNPDEAILSLKPQSEEDPDPNSLIEPVSGFSISQTDSEIAESVRKFFKKLKRQLKNTNGFSSGEFLRILNSFLENLGKKIGISVGIDPSENGYTSKLVEKLGFLMGQDVAGLVMEACFALEIWDVLEALIVHKIVANSNYSNLINVLAEKKKSDLLCLCMKHFWDLQLSSLLCILQYFLSPSKDAYSSMVMVRKEWENQAFLAVEKATDKTLKGKKLRVANEASILLMIAYDGFSVSELCLHYLLSSGNLDELVLSSAISKLNGSEMMGLIRYLGKWLKKYERFPQARPCQKASLMLGLKACDWVPTIEDIVKCLVLVLDEHFSSLVLHPEFHEELRSIQGAVNSLALEARLCCSVANVVENLRTKEIEG